MSTVAAIPAGATAGVSSALAFTIPVDAPLYSATVLTIPFSLSDPLLDARLAGVRDVEGKVPRALQDLGPIADRRVAVLGDASGSLVDRLQSLGGQIVAGLAHNDLGSTTSCAADVVVALDEEMGTASKAAENRLAAVERLLCRSGRLLVTLHYGRDDVGRLLGMSAIGGGADATCATAGAATDDAYTALRQRDRWFLQRGFKMRVVHGWWTFRDLDDAADFLGAAFDTRGAAVAASMRRPRLSYNVVIYHRSLGGPNDSGIPSTEPREDAAAGEQT